MKKSFFNIDSAIMRHHDKAMEKIQEPFKLVEETTQYNQEKVLAAFIENGVSESHFVETTGYGYGDRGRDTLDRVFAMSMGTEDALVRHSFASGTHTISVALFGVLRPGDTMLCVTGTPYDTLHPIIGLQGQGQGSLKDFGVTYKEIDLTEDGRVDFFAIEEALKNTKVDLVYIQRSRGYSLRPSLSVEEIGKIVRLVKTYSNVAVVVDNCYGECV